MVYLRQMSMGKQGCPKFRLRWRGPYEVIQRFSDLNYLIIPWNKEFVVNVNKMEKCCVNTASPPNGTRDAPARDQEGDGSRDVTADDEVTPLASHDHFEKESSSISTPSTMTDEGKRIKVRTPPGNPVNVRRFRYLQTRHLTSERKRGTVIGYGIDNVKILWRPVKPRQKWRVKGLIPRQQKPNLPRAQ
jgi:hypothetical protein